jgi:hypothetical protein
MLTAEIIQSTAERPMHLLSSADLGGMFVSSSSKWDSADWEFDNPSHGQRANASRVHWAIEFPDGSRFTAPQHHGLLDWLRRVVWSLCAVPGDGVYPLAPGSMVGISAGLARIVPWLVEHAIRWPHELTTEVLDQLLADLPERLARVGGGGQEGEEDETTVSRGAARNAIGIIYYIWRQREALRESGILPMPSQPWPEYGGADALAGKMTKDIEGWIQPLPDEVAAPVLNTATWFLGVPAQDILRLRKDCEAAFARGPGTHHSGPGTTDYSRRIRQRRAAIEFEFSTVEGETDSWHESLLGRTRTDGRAAPMMRVRQLVTCLQAACCLVLQGFTGMRVSELCGLRAGDDPKTGLPFGVGMRLSPTGLNEEFILRSELSKGKRSPREVPWLLGSRRVGETDLPLCVQALRILDQLLAPYRAMIGTDRLLVSITTRPGLPKTALSVRKITGERVNALLRAFICEWVNLSALADESRHATSANDLVRWRESKGTIITTHQLRKTFAAYVLAVHPELLPAVKRQFHHMSMMITEGSYWGSNAPQIEPIHSISRQLTARMLYEATQGKIKIVGRMGKQVEDNLEELRELVAGRDKPAAWARINRWVEDNDLHVNHGNHGLCVPVTGSRMECWKRVGLRPIGRLEPNYETREASLCAGCSCFLMHHDHVPFWRDRFVDSEVSLRQATQLGIDGPYLREVRRRGEQARKLLADAGLSVAMMEDQIVARVAQHA